VFLDPRFDPLAIDGVQPEFLFSGVPPLPYRDQG
jgi:hypothetical protein